MRFAELDAVTLDAFGTLVTLADPVPALELGVRRHGIERTPEQLAEAFAAEVAYYRRHSFEGRDRASLAQLRLECTRVFLEALGADLGPAEFVDSFMGAIQLELLPGAGAALRSLRRRGLAIAVASNWDIALPEHLEGLGLRDLSVVTSAAAGVAKPDPAALLLALERLAVPPERALHIGDDEADRLAAEAAGMQFAPAPLEAAIEDSA